MTSGGAELTGRLLDYEFAVRIGDPSWVDPVARMLADSVSEVVAPEEFVLDRTRGDDVVLRAPDEEDLRASGIGPMLPFLAWRLNQRVLDRPTASVLLHAGAVTCADGRAVVISGPSHAGKSTTTLGLALRGFGYLSDDVVALDPGGRIRGSLKPGSLRRPSLVVLGLEHDGVLDERLHEFAWGGSELVVPASRLGLPSVDAAEARVVIFPSVDLAPGEVEEVPRSRALASVAEETFNLPRVGVPGFVRLADMIRGAIVFKWGRSSVDDLVQTLAGRFGVVP
jgi:hypothetical protein